MKIETYRAHRILKRRRNFESLANEILFSNKYLPQSVKENTRHKKTYSEVATERYYNVMCFYLNSDVQLREPEFVIEPNLLWIVATPDGHI